MHAKGFTLIELLVTVSIIGVLSTIGTVSYSSARASSRDVKRVSDVKQLQSSLELFFETHSAYPGDGRPGQEGAVLGLVSTKNFSDAGFGPVVVGLPYMIGVPENPSPNGSPYVYRALTQEGRDCDAETCESYAILFTLEKVSGSYLGGPHALTPRGIVGAEGGYGGEGVVVGGSYVGIEGSQARLDELATIASEEIARFVEDPTVKTVAGVAVAPVATAAAIANTAATGASASAYLWLILSQPFALLGRKKRERWGTVYGTLTRLPVDLATVRLRDATSGRVIKSTVTDAQGRYSFLTEPGRYRIEASRVGFMFPSAMLAGAKEDGPFLDVYHGEDVMVATGGALLTPNIPMDPVGVPESDDAIHRRETLRRFRRAVAVFSPVLGALVLIIDPTWVTGTLFAVQVSLYAVFRRVAEPPAPKNWGMVYDVDSKRPVQKAIVRIFENKYNKLLEAQVTDDRGRYHFRVGGNVYYVTVTKQGFQKTQSEPVDLSTKNEPTVIATDLPLKKTV